MRPLQRGRKSADSTAYDLTFGTISWQKVNEQVQVFFEPEYTAQINTPKEPLGAVGKHLATKDLMSIYFATLQHGVSNPDLRWPPHNTSTIVEKLRALKHHIEFIESAKEPLLVTHEWLHNASRFRTRLLCKDEAAVFQDDVLSTLEGYPELTLRNKDWLRREISFQFSSVFSFAKGYDDSSAESYAVYPGAVVRATLDGYGAQAPNSWQYTLHSMTEEVLVVFGLGPYVFINDNVRVLDFQESDDLWTQKVFVQSSSGIWYAPLLIISSFSHILTKLPMLLTHVYRRCCHLRWGAIYVR